MKGNYILDGYSFPTREEYEKAVKEQEAITYMRANSDLSNTRTVLKIYNKLLDKNTFRTILGYDFLRELQKILKEDSSIEEEKIRAIPVQEKQAAAPPKTLEHPSQLAKRSEKFELLYEYEKSKSKRLVLIIGGLLIIIFAMFGVAQFTPYSVFTNYEEKIIDKYEDWEQQLSLKEAELAEKEKAMSE